MCIGHFVLGRTYFQFLSCCALVFPIKFKRVVALTDEVQQMLSSPGTVEFNTVLCLKFN